jgi:hypothetical protein
MRLLLLLSFIAQGSGPKSPAEPDANAERRR